MDRRRHLADLLDRHTPADALEAQHLAGMRALCAEAADDPMYRAHWDPGHFTASAFVLSPDDSALLLIFHGKLHRWLQPGGHIDPDDTDVVAAALREVQEETGLSAVVPVGDGLLDVDIHEIPARKDDPTHQHLDVRILLRAVTWDFEAGSDAKDARWVPLDEISEVESDASVVRAVAKLRTRICKMGA